MRTAISILLIAVGLIWQYGMRILDWVGRVLDVVELGNYIIDFQLWLVNNPNLGNDLGPWTFVVIGFLSLLATHAVPPLYKSWKQHALEIVYDPADEQGRFGGVGKWSLYKSDEPPIQSFVLRVGVQNNTRETINAVTGTVEGSLTGQPFPVALRFSRTLELEENLDPGRMLLMDVFGMPPDPDNWPEGVHKIIVRVNGRDTSETMRRFCIDKSRMPVMYADS